MNVFASSQNPARAATYLDDRRVNKMILESVQLLSNNMYARGLKGPIKLAQVHHPLNKWLLKDSLNYWWLLLHYSALMNQYAVRRLMIHEYAKFFTHLYQGAPDKFPTIDEFYKHVQLANFASNKKLGLNFREVTPVWKAYREYLSARWDRAEVKPTWVNREQPDWYEYVPVRKKAGKK